MVRYLSLLTFTQQGMSQIQESPARATEFNAAVGAAGGRVVSQYWSLGEIDAAVVFEVPDDTSAAALLADLAKQGHVRARSQRVYDEKEFGAIVAKL